MKIETFVLNEQGNVKFKSEDDVDFDTLRQMVKEREKIAKNQGPTWTAGAITFFGDKVIKAVENHDSTGIAASIYSMMIANWVFDSVFGGSTEADYQKINMRFTIGADGSVSTTRILA